MSERESIGVIAGNGVYPETFVDAARNAGVARVVAAAFEGETDTALAGRVDAMAWFRVGQLGRLIKFFKREGVSEAVMAGQIAPRNLFELRPDLRTLLMVGRLRERNAESLFGGIAAELAKDGITLLPATTYLERCLPAAGPVAGPALGHRRLADAAFGFRIAKVVSALDIGQSVVVKRGTVLAVEAFEGTDEAMRRGGALARGGAMLVKVSKPDQDFRFDVPVVGRRTIETAADAGIDAVVIEAGRTLVLEDEAVQSLCGERRVSLHAMDGEGDGTARGEGG